MRLRKNFCKKKNWPVSDLDPDSNPDPKPDLDPKLTSGRIRIRNRIRNFCFGSATLPHCLFFFSLGRFLRGISWWGVEAAPPIPASRTDSRSSRSQPTAPSASAPASPRKKPKKQQCSGFRSLGSVCLWASRIR